MPRERLLPAEVELLYRELLGRAPSPGEVEHQLASGASLGELLQVVLASPEYAAGPHPRAAHRAGTTPFVVNTYHPDLAAWTHQPGTRSQDEVAIVGREGWLFLSGGTNANLEQFRGEVPMEQGWLDGWRRLLERRSAAVDALGAQMTFLIVPDKLAVYQGFYPGDLTGHGPRPVQRLLEEAGLPITYPLEELRARAQHEDVFLRTDSHLSLVGNHVLHHALCAALGVPSRVTLEAAPRAEYLTSGDLGSRFDPQILEVARIVRGLLGACVTEDNRDEIAAVGGHIGTRRVYVNDGAPDARTAVIFGDSYGFGAEYYQGVAWFMAQQYGEVHFVWVPLGWDPGYVRDVGAQIVVFQAAERFVARLPQDAVQVHALAAETLRRKTALGLETVFEAD